MTDWLTKHHAETRLAVANFARAVREKENPVKARAKLDARLSTVQRSWEKEFQSKHGELSPEGPDRNKVTVVDHVLQTWQRMLKGRELSQREATVAAEVLRKLARL
jgi:predicted nucleic acid-binding Zn ribbon protein